jgi:hypothetical protein
VSAAVHTGQGWLLKDMDTTLILHEERSLPREFGMLSPESDIDMYVLRVLPSTMLNIDVSMRNSYIGTVGRETTCIQCSSQPGSLGEPAKAAVTSEQ